MKMFSKTIYILSIFLLISFLVLLFSKTNINSSEYISDSKESENMIENEFELISKKVIPYIVEANVIIDDKKYTCEVIEDKGNGQEYLVLLDNKKIWIDNEYVTILKPKETKVDDLLDNEIEKYVNVSLFSSSTDYFIWVDLYRNQTYILEYINNQYKLVRKINCSTGANITPTKRGLYVIDYKGESFIGRDKTYKCYYYLRYSGSYLLHSFPYDFDGNVLDNRLNERISNGCVRYSKEDAKYIYELIPLNTSIWIN